MELRSYQAADLAGCLAIFDSNTPTFFAPHERAEFIEFLANTTDPYFVVVDEQGQIIGCGGYYIKCEHTAAGLSWGMVNNRLHRQGVGHFLLLARLQRICQEPDVTSILINTSQHSYGFFEKVGFVVESIVENGFTEGLHKYNDGVIFKRGNSSAAFGIVQGADSSDVDLPATASESVLPKSAPLR